MFSLLTYTEEPVFCQHPKMKEDCSAIDVLCITLEMFGVGFERFRAGVGLERRCRGWP